MTENEIAGLLVGDSRTIYFKIPKKLLTALLETAKKRDPTRRDHGLPTHAITYFAARGMLDWQEKNTPNIVRNRGPLPELEPKRHGP